MRLHRSTAATRVLLLFVLATACNESTQGAGLTDADADASVGDPNETNAAELIEHYEPEAGADAARNAAVHIDFWNALAPETLLVEIDGVPARLSTLDDQHYRFIPLPLFEPGAEIAVTVVAGVEDLGGGVLDGDFTWIFHTDAARLDVDGDPTLGDDEIAHILEGDVDEPMDLVQDWEDPESRLYEISLPLDPESADVQHLVARMMVSVVHHGGIGLAAPQVGINRRLFVASVGEGYEAFLNPVLLERSDEFDGMAEGCLSVPGAQYTVFRPRWIELSHDADDGSHVDFRRIENPPANPFSYPARVWLHEFDHLNGIIIPDRDSLR